VDPREVRRAGQGISMEAYLGDLFNQGAVLVNIFGWGLGDENYPFRKIAESHDALMAYRKFLAGQTLTEAPVPDLLATLPTDLRERIQKLQAELPGFLRNHGPTQIQNDIENMNQAVEDERFDDAEKSAEAILKKIER
jgi:hypothetical protein